jgi:hypothetical protein
VVVTCGVEAAGKREASDGSKGPDGTVAEQPGDKQAWKYGSAQQSVKMCILRGFLETRTLVLRSAQRRHLHQNGQNCAFAVEVTLGGTYAGILAEDLLPVPPSLETRTKRGFPHFHSDDDGGLMTATRAQP